MNKVTVILGVQGCGKTTKAKELIAGRSYVISEILNKRDEENPSEVITRMLRDNHKAEVLLIEGVNSIPTLKYLCSLESTSVRLPYSRIRTYVKVPELIITSQSLTMAHFPEQRRGIEYIEISEDRACKYYNILNQGE